VSLVQRGADLLLHESDDLFQHQSLAHFAVLLRLRFDVLQRDVHDPFEGNLAEPLHVAAHVEVFKQEPNHDDFLGQRVLARDFGLEVLELALKHLTFVLDLPLVLLDGLERLDDFQVLDDVVRGAKDVEQLLLVVLLRGAEYFDVFAGVDNLLVDSEFFGLKDLEPDGVLNVAVRDAEVDKHDFGRDLGGQVHVLRACEQLEVEVGVDVDLLLEHLDGPAVGGVDAGRNEAAHHHVDLFAGGDQHFVSELHARLHGALEVGVVVLLLEHQTGRLLLALLDLLYHVSAVLLLFVDILPVEFVFDLLEDAASRVDDLGETHFVLNHESVDYRQ